jgi:methionyl-tRNA formyltransferase
MRIVFAGTPEFAKVALARLHGKELIVLESTVAAPSIFSRASREACYAAGEAAARAFIQPPIS